MGRARIRRHGGGINRNKREEVDPAYTAPQWVLPPPLYSYIPRFALHSNIGTSRGDINKVCPTPLRTYIVNIPLSLPPLENSVHTATTACDG